MRRWHCRRQRQRAAAVLTVTSCRLTRDVRELSTSHPVPPPLHSSVNGMLVFSQAILSLEPLLELLAALARDLQADFLPLLRPALSRLSTFAEAKGASLM